MLRNLARNTHLMESDDQLIMNELIREINNTCHVKIRGFSDLCDSYIKGAGSIIAKHINCFHSHLILLPWFSIWSEAKSMNAGE